MKVLIQIEVEIPQRQWQTKRREKAKQREPISPRRKKLDDWDSLLHSATVLYGDDLPGCRVNQLLNLPFIKAKRVLLRMRACRERHHYLKIGKFRDIMRGELDMASAKQLSLFD